MNDHHTELFQRTPVLVASQGHSWGARYLSQLKHVFCLLCTVTCEKATLPQIIEMVPCCLLERAKVSILPQTIEILILTQRWLKIFEDVQTLSTIYMVQAHIPICCKHKWSTSLSTAYCCHVRWLYCGGPLCFCVNDPRACHEVSI